MLRLDAYIRVSKVNGRGGESFISPDVQRQQIAATATLLGARVVREHVDLDQSGANGERPGWQAALARIESGETDGIVVAKLDRFARSTLDAVEALRRIEAAGGHFVSAAERFDTTTPFGKFAQTVMFAMAELEHARIRDNWSVATERAVGRSVHTTVPYGYRRGPDKRLIVEEREATAVRLIFALRAGGETWNGVLDRLNGAGHRPRKASSWSKPSVKRIASNRAYVGEAFYGAHRTVDAHEPLVSERDWQAAQARGERPIIRRADGGPLLAGLVRCASCSYTMSGANSNRKWLIYRCNRRHGGGRCPAPTTIMQGMLDEHIERIFLAHAGALEVEAVSETTALEAADAELERARRELTLWRDDVRMREAIGHEHYLAGLSKRAEDVTAAEAALWQARESVAAAGIAFDSAIWPELTRVERRTVLSAGIDAIFVQPGRLNVEGRTRVLWRGEAPHDLPRRGIAAEVRPFVW